MNSRTRRRGTLVAVMVLSLSSAASAMNGLVLMDPPPETGLRWATGLSMWRLRTLPGDTPRQRTWVYPGLDAMAANGLFVSTDTGIGWNLSKDPGTQAGVRWSPWPGRRAAAVQVGTRMEQGAFLNHALGPALLLQSSVRHGAAARGDGWIGEMGVTSGLPLPAGELLGVTVGSSWANGAYRSSYAGHGASRAGGWQDVQWALSYEHRFDADWRLDGQWLTARTNVHGTRTDLVLPDHRRARQQSLSLGLWRDWR